MRILATAMLLLAGCAAGAGGRQLRGADWTAVDLNGVSVTGAAPTLRLDGGRASGSGGCNSWSASYKTQAREQIRFGPIAATRMACEAAAMEQERRYFEILGQAQGYSFYGDGSISIVAADGRAVRLRRR